MEDDDLMTDHSFTASAVASLLSQVLGAARPRPDLDGVWMSWEDMARFACDAQEIIDFLYEKHRKELKNTGRLNYVD